MMRYQVTGLYRQCSECKAPVFLMNNDLNFKQSLTIFEENGTMWGNLLARHSKIPNDGA